MLSVYVQHYNGVRDCHFTNILDDVHKKGRHRDLLHIFSIRYFIFLDRFDPPLLPWCIT